MSASSSPLQQQVNQNLTGSVLPSNVTTSSNKSSQNSSINSNFIHATNSNPSLVSSNEYQSTTNLQANILSNSNPQNQAGSIPINSSTPNNPNSNQSVNLNTSTTSNTPNNNVASNLANTNNGYHAGYLLKWTNYIKGYQKRWFVLNNGLLSYFRSQAEMAHTCRGTINLCNAIIQSEDLYHFVVSNGGQQTFHLKALNELEKQKWVSALEIAKNKAKQFGYGNSAVVGAGFIGGNQQDSDDEDNGGFEAEKNELANMIKILQQKLDDLSTSHEFVLKHSSALNKSLTELESIQNKPDESLIKTINERSTVYKITMLAVVNACQEFINLAQLQTRKMNKVLQSEREMRSKLEEMVQEMAKQHLNFETQLNKRSKRNGLSRASNQEHSTNSNNNQTVQSSTVQGIPNITSSTSVSFNKNSSFNQKNQSEQQTKRTEPVGSSETNQNKKPSQGSSQAENEEEIFFENTEDDQYQNEDEFHDAVEDVQKFSVTLPRQKLSMHHRNPSNISKLYLQESDISSEDEEQQMIKVTMHSNKEQQNDAGKQVATPTVSSKSNNFSENKKQSSNDLNALKSVVRTVKQRRKEITPRPNYSINLWSIMKNCIGKDLSKIPIPVNFSEPLSMLQRITEELEYSSLLDLAANSEDQWEQMAYIAAFTVSSYSTTATRTNKPFNPILGETFECDRLDDFGWRSITEQVSHHPPGFATHVESIRDWKYYQDFNMSSKFRGQYLQVIPLGTSHVEFKKSGHHYTWRKVATFVRNIIVGKLWIDNVGEMDIINHKTKDVCHLKYFAYSYFSKEPPRKVTGIITDSNNVARYVLNGTWTEQIEGAPVLNPQVVTEQTQLNTGASKVLWRRRYPPAYLETMYNFTELAVQLNEPEPGVAPTDSRLRPDQRFMEEAQWDEANKEKLRLEEKQRVARKKRESIANISSTQDDINNQNTNSHSDYEPIWFKKTIDPYTNLPIHISTNEYWVCKENQDWRACPDIF